MSEENTTPNQEPQVDIIPPSDFKPWGIEKKQFLLFMHLGQFLNFFCSSSWNYFTYCNVVAVQGSRCRC